MRVNKGGCPLPAPPLRIVWLIERGQVGAFFRGETERGGCFPGRMVLGRLCALAVTNELQQPLLQFIAQLFRRQVAIDLLHPICEQCDLGHLAQKLQAPHPASI